MDKDKILSFIKKNVLALACGGVAIAAVVASFYPFNGMVAELQEKATQEAGNFATMGGYLHTRHLPLVDPAKATPVDLAPFPNAEQVKVGQKAVDRLSAESKQTMAFLVGLNNQTVHPLLIAGLLPKPSSDTLKFQFADVYKRVLSMDPTVSGVGPPAVDPPVQGSPGGDDVVPMAVDEHLAAAHAKNLCNDVLHAGMPADKDLIKAREDWIGQNVFGPKIVYVNGLPTNKTEVDKAFADAKKLVPDELAAEIAAKKQVYLDKDAFAFYPAFLPSVTNNPDMSAIWMAQMQLWVQTDVANAIAALNANGHGVAQSPVKRILRLELMPTLYRFPPGGTGGMPGAAGGVPSTADETQKIDPAYAVSPTGRTSNKMYDVVPFYLTIDVDAAKVNDVIAGLTRDRLTYVYNQNLSTIDPVALAAQGYQYGSVPIVRLTLSGEELFLRSWTADLMPDRIKQALGLAPATPGNAGMPGMTQPGAGPQPTNE